MTYTFKLRDGLMFHDGSPVTSKDVVASMNRWGKRDGAGKQLMGYTTSITAKDDKTFVWVLNEPYGLLIDILAKTRSEEHTSELQSLMRKSYADFCLKKKK